MKKSTKRPTIKKIAEMAGVTHTTVSNVLNNAGRVGEETRQRVQAIIEELGYKPDVVAQGLVKKRLKIIGMIVPSFHDDFSHDVFLGIENYAKQLGYKVLVGLSNNQEEEEKRLVEEFTQMRVAGLIILPSPNYWNKHPLYQTLLEENELPFVFYTRYPREGQYDRVLCDDREGGKMAVRHLIEKDHQTIGFYYSRLLENANDTIAKLEGYLDALAEAGIEVKPELKLRADQVNDAHDFKQWIEKHHVTALFVSTDYAAIGLMHQLKEIGIHVPEDLAIIGYDNIRLGNMVMPRLTTIDVPKKDIGVAAAKKVVEAATGVDGTEEGNDGASVFKPKLVIREST